MLASAAALAVYVASNFMGGRREGFIEEPGTRPAGSPTATATPGRAKPPPSVDIAMLDKYQAIAGALSKSGTPATSEGIGAMYKSMSDANVRIDGNSAQRFAGGDRTLPTVRPGTDAALMDALERRLSKLAEELDAVLDEMHAARTRRTSEVGGTKAPTRSVTGADAFSAKPVEGFSPFMDDQEQ